jgi:hypothetical protein
MAALHKDRLELKERALRLWRSTQPRRPMKQAGPERLISC